MIRHLKPEDVTEVLELSTAAGWNQTAEDWRRMIELEPEGAFGVERDGKLVATTTLIAFGSELAWIGMVLTHPDYQRRGFARRLVEAALATARRRGVRTVKLDATDQGHALYESLGFVDEQPIERWRRPARAHDSLPHVTGEIPLELDREAFGADRSRFLATLPAAFVDSSGYVIRRPGVRASYLGPCVARDPHTAERLIAAALDEGVWFWDLLPANQPARIIATEFGFEPVRHLMRMRTGAPLRVKDERVYAIAGFEAG